MSRSADEISEIGARFARSVCDMFVDDLHWSVLDLDGAQEFFDSISFVPPVKAVSVGDEEAIVNA